MKNKLFSSTALVLALSFALCAAPRPSHALMLLTEGLKNDTDDFANPAFDVACIMLLPLCLLDEKKQVKEITSRDLADNGYSPQEIAVIQTSQQAVLNYMKAHGLNTSVQMQQVVREMGERLNPDYLAFIAE